MLDHLNLTPVQAFCASKQGPARGLVRATLQQTCGPDPCSTRYLVGTQLLLDASVHPEVVELAGTLLQLPLLPHNRWPLCSTVVYTPHYDVGAASTR